LSYDSPKENEDAAHLLKIALVVHDFDPGFGQGRYCWELAKRLGARCRLEVHANRWNAPELPNVTWRRVPAWRRGALSTVFSFIFSAQRSLRRHPAELVHTQGLASWKADVVTAHVCNAARASTLAGAHWKDRWFARLLGPVEHRFYRRPGPKLVIAISKAVEQEITTFYGWNRAVRVIYHGVDADRFRPPASPQRKAELRTRFGVPGDAPVWLFMGEAAKGLGEVLEALVHFPNARVLVISRSAPEPWNCLATKLGVTPRMHFHGPERLPELAFQAADVFTYPASYDTFAMVAAEAMATGLPVVLGRTIGAAEWITDGVNGALCDAGKPETLTDALRRLTKAPALAAKIGTAARRTAEAHGWDACAEATWEAYLQTK
jgi:UDP-glucose:(heptosyl)LPS alpha-1,3-glucosyltransferase